MPSQETSLLSDNRCRRRARVSTGGSPWTVSAPTAAGDRCTLRAVHEVGGTWAIYPHGVGKLGVRLPVQQARKMALAILRGSR